MMVVLVACGGAAPLIDGSTGTSMGVPSTTSGVATTSTSASHDSSTVTSGSDTAESSASTNAPADTSGSGSGETTGGRPACAGELPAAWPDGLDCSVDEIAVHRYDQDTYILRQSLCTSFEAPFLYLLFGDDRVLLEDTGAGGVDVSGVVGAVIEQWLADNGRNTIELVVVNSHAHGDHVAGNPMFEGLPGVTVVTPSVAGLSAYFGIDRWPEQIVPFDLGGRVVDVIPIPGHQQSHIALFDHGSGLLLTGDTLYPGRLYIQEFSAYVDSIGRLVDAVADEPPCHVLGTHIEMTSVPGVDFEFGAHEHPDEHRLELDHGHLLELYDAVSAMASPTFEVHDDFIIYPL